jgi:hypothetical protein
MSAPAVHIAFWFLNKKIKKKAGGTMPNNKTLQPGTLTGRVLFLNTPDIVATFNKTGFVGNGPFDVVSEKSFKGDGDVNAVQVKDVAGKITFADSRHFTDEKPEPPTAA